MAAIETKEPVLVHCGKCKHEWPAAYLPMEMETFAKVLKGRCPMCGADGNHIFLGPIPKSTPTGEALAWLGNGDTGTSSLTIWHVMHGSRPKHADIPYDPADFGRCYRLLQVMPAWRERLGEVAAAYPDWAPFVGVWHELTALFEHESPAGTCPRLWARMRELRGAR